MKRYDFHCYHKKESVQDALIILAPPILMLVGILWFFREDPVPMRLTHVIASFLSLY